MNFIDRAINFLAPVTGLKRARARYATRIYEGASTGRRAAAWKALHTSQNAELMYAIRPLRDRARELVRNTPHAPRMLDILTSHTVGTGIVPVSSTGSDRLDRQVNELWEDWVECADITGLMSFYAMQALAVRSMVESGEVVARFIDMEMSDDLPVPMQIQLLESDYIDQFRDGIYGDADTIGYGLCRTRLGVGLGEFDKFLGLWLFRNHPGELNTIWRMPYISDFVPMGKGDLVHMYKMLRPGQVRGVPWMAPILTTARELADFHDSAMVKARIEACFAGFVINDDSTAPLFDETQDQTQQSIDAANPNAMVTTLEPGMLKELRTGQDIKFAQPSTTSQIEPIMMADLQAMAAGVGCTYDQMSGDLRQANYSSLRAGKLDFWRLIAQLQKHTVIPKLCKPTWKRFISRAILSGRLRDRVGGYPCDWVVPAKEMIDPKKDFDAAKNAVRAGAMTPQQFIASFGGEWRTQLEDFRTFFAEARKTTKEGEMPVVLDIDVSQVDQHGRKPTAKAPPKDGAEDDTASQADAEDAADIAVDDAADDADDDSRIYPLAARGR